MRLHDPFEDYLKPGKYIDFEDGRVAQKAWELAVPDDQVETARRAYRFVRDEIHHSWDVQDKRITARASEALREGVGICWAKANLLAALLRADHIPCGVCYQRLTLGDTPDTGCCIHALNAVYLQGRWARLDARGNKPGICAEFSLDGERLAFPVRPEFGEVDYPDIYAQPLPVTMEVLEANTDALYMYLHALPGEIE